MLTDPNFCKLANEQRNRWANARSFSCTNYLAADYLVDRVSYHGGQQGLALLTALKYRPVDKKLNLDYRFNIKTVCNLQFLLVS